MEKKYPLIAALALAYFVHAEDVVPPPPIPPQSVIEKQLQDAEKEFKEAKEMFNPWYAGPLLTPSAHILPPGLINAQPYFFYTNTFARYDKHGKSHDLPHHLITMNPSVGALIGILDWMEASFSAQYVHNKQDGHKGSGWGDTSASLGFGLHKETPYFPAMLFGIKEVFPTGRYQHLHASNAGLDGIGAGSFQTVFSYNISKVVWWVTKHPMNLRLSLNYGIPSNVKVKGLNSYGGTKNTKGTVNLGNNFTADFGYEYSFTQRWVLACDVVYTYTAKRSFSGRTGGAILRGPFNDQLSLAPALEYNPNANLGLLLGTWFTVWGRNSPDFISGVASFTYTF